MLWLQSRPDAGQQLKLLGRLVQRGGRACKSEFRTAPAERVLARVLARVRVRARARAQARTWVECVGLLVQQVAW